MQIKRGDIFYADLSPVVGSEQGGVRPVLIIQNDVGNRHSPTVICAAITSKMNKAKLPTHIELSSQKYDMDKDSVILLEQLRTIDKKRLKEKMGHLDEQMMQEIAAIKQAINPQETLFVVDAMTGQDAVNTAKEFNDRLDFDGVILTKLDGDARGGAALSIRSVVQKPIKFIGTGEKMDALDVFHPSRMADRILGMGDVVSLVERAQEQYDEEEARRISKRIAKNQFDFNDFLSQLAQIKKMGSMKELMGMIPGMDKALKGVEVSDDAFKPIEAIISSMTPAERSNPSLLNGSRKNRIAKGSGTSIVEVNRFLKQFEQTSKMMKKMQQMQGFRRR